MSVIEIKEQLHNAIDAIEDESFLEAILTILTTQSHNSYTEVEEKQLKILQEREERYVSGETGNISLEEFKLKMKKKYGL